MSILRATQVCFLSGFVALAAGCADDPRMSTLEQRVHDLLNELGDSNNQLGDSAARVKMLSEQVATLRQERGSLANELDRSGTLLSTASGSLKAAQARLQSAGYAATIQLRRFGLQAPPEVALDAHLESLGDSLASASARASAASEQAQNATAAMRKLTTRIGVTEQAREQLAAQLNGLTRAHTDELSSLAQAHETLHGEFEAEQERTMYNAQIMQTLYADYQQSLAQIQALEAAKTYLEEQITLTERAEKTAKSELSDAQTLLRTATITREALEIATTELSTRTAVATTEAKRLANAESYIFKLFEERGVELLSTKSQLRSKSEEALGLATNLADISAQLTALETEQRALTKDRDDLSGALNTTIAKATKLQALLHQTKTNLDATTQRAEQAELATLDASKQAAQLYTFLVQTEDELDVATKRAVKAGQAARQATEEGLTLGAQLVEARQKAVDANDQAKQHIASLTKANAKQSQDYKIQQASSNALEQHLQGTMARNATQADEIVQLRAARDAIKQQRKAQ